MTNIGRSFKRGFLWLGSAQLMSRLLDTGSLIVLLWFLTREEIGLATLAWTAAVFIEAFNGLGVGTSIVQTGEISRRQLDSLYWYTMVTASTLVAAVCLLSPWLASFYGSPELRWMIALASAKLLFVAAALVPMQLLNRELKFREIGAAQSLATLLASLTKIFLAWAGLGAWALVIGHTAQGLFLLAVVGLLRPYLPRLRFRFREIKPMVSFGLKVSASSIIYHFYRNLDYLIIGRVFGNAALGVYRVGFDIAMTPALVILGIINRTAFPIFSRISSRLRELRRAFLWVQRNLALATLPLAVFFSFAARDVALLIGGQKWLEAAPVLQLLGWAAVLRCAAQVFPQLFHALGRPEWAIVDSLFSLGVLAAGFSLFLLLFRESLGVLAMGMAWLACYPVLLTVLWLISRKLMGLSFIRFASAFRDPAALTAGMAGVAAGLAAVRSCIPFGSWLFVGVLAVMMLSVFPLYTRIRGDSIRAFLDKGIEGIGAGEDPA